MPSFLDNTGREWQVRISVNEIRRIREHNDFNIVDGVNVKTGDPQRLVDALQDPVMLLDVLYSICMTQCESRGVAIEQFCEGLIGDALEEATTALLEALCDFFPKKDREMLRMYLNTEKAKRLSSLLDLVVSHFGGPASNSQELQESTPAGSVSAN